MSKTIVDTLVGCARFALMVIAVLVVALCLPQQVHAHFSYSDPRIVHIAEQGEERSVVLIRMPAPLALLPDDWQGSEETRIPPFATVVSAETVLDLTAVVAGDAAIRERLNGAVTLWAEGRRIATYVEQYRFWSDNARPQFGTLKSALAAFDAPADDTEILQVSYFDLTLDVMITVPLTSLSEELQLTSQLGHRFRVMDKLGTVVKLHRNHATETGAMLGILDVSFPKIVTQWETLPKAALIGAEHIYLGLDHLAMILLIAIAAVNWRRALVWASAFTLGHMITLAAGLYGVAPAGSWFVPMVELAIALSIVAAGVMVVLRRNHTLNGVSLLIVGLIHGYGFAASASTALFAGSIDLMTLAAFALGLEFCQFAVYALALPLILLLDRASSPIRVNWRRATAFSIALSASIVVILRLTETSNVLGII